MLKGLWKNDWVVQLAVVIGYSLVYAAIRPVSDAHWALTGGLRLSCLLLMHPRYWGALVVGDFLSLAPTVYEGTGAFGAGWAGVMFIPPTLIAIPIVWWFKHHQALFPSKLLINFKALLQCSLLVSLAWAAINFAALALMPPQARGVLMQPLTFLGLFTGKYIAILSIVPWALMARNDHKTGGLLTDVQQFAKSTIAADMALLLLPALLCLSWLSFHSGEQTRQVTQMVMFLPVAWLTLKHGWRGAALGGTLAIACVSLLLADRPDPEILQTQAFMIVTISILYALGARIAAQTQRESRERFDSTRTIRVSQQALYQAELRMRQTSEALERASGAMQITHDSLLTRFQHVLPTTEMQRYQKLAANTQTQVYGLSDSLHPNAWRERGLPAAFQEKIARVLDEAAIAYSCEMTGQGLDLLSPPIHAALYRLACEAVVYACSQPQYSEMRIRLRGGKSHGHRWALLRLEANADHVHANDALYGTYERHAVALKLGATGMGLASMRDYVALYSGELHVRAQPKNLRIALLLHDSAGEERVRSHATAPARLWAQ